MTRAAGEVVVLDLLDEPERRALPPVLVLAAQEGRRMALHPVVLVGLLLWAGTTALGVNGPRDAFEMVTSAVTWFFGVPVLFAANLTASRDRRAGSTEMLAPAAVPHQVRVQALCLAALVPAAASLAVVLVAHAVQQSLGRYLAVPDAWHLLTGPVSVLGGALLGVMVARWLPVPGAAALVVVGLVAWNVATSNGPAHYQPLGTYVTWALWSDSGAGWAGFMPGSPAWHVGYLLGLSAMAATGALLPGARSRPAVLAVGAALTAVTGVLASVQLT